MMLIHGRGCLALLATALIACGLISCGADATRGYAFSSTRQSEVRSVAVPIFNNTTFTRGIEFDLTDALVKEIQRTTPWAITRSDAAQTVLTGTITGSDLRPLTFVRSEGYVQEMAVRLTVDFEWRDVRTGRLLASRRGLTAAETFVPARPAGERLELGEHAAVAELARIIVAEMRTDW